MPNSLYEMHLQRIMVGLYIKLCQVQVILLIGRESLVKSIVYLEL